jgi:hypothetical protein
MGLSCDPIDEIVAPREGKDRVVRLPSLGVEDHNPLAAFRAHIDNRGCGRPTLRPRELWEFEILVELPVEKVRRAGKTDAPLVIA